MAMHLSVVSAAFAATSLISIAPNLLLYLFPRYGAEGENPRERAALSVGQAIAVGGLLGDVFLHALPECFADGAGHGHDHDHHHHDHDHNHRHDHDHGAGGDVGLRVILGFLAFLLLDVFVRSLEGRRGCHEGSAKDADADDGARRPQRLLSSAVLLNLLGDALHNFTDGLAIGASFAADAARRDPADDPAAAPTTLGLLRSRGGLAALAVLLHEVPHELGDFATLVRGGLGRDAAIRAQFGTALAAFAGTAAGLFADRVVAGLDHAVLVPVTAGGFLYLGAVTILPDVLATEAGPRLRVAQVGGVLLGVALLYGVARLEELDAPGGHGHGAHGHGHGHGEL